MAVSVRAPLDIIAQACKYFAYFNVTPDPDGTMRRVDLFIRVDNYLVPSLVLASAARYLNSDIRPVVGNIRPTAIDGIKLTKDIFIPTGFLGQENL